MFILNIKLNLLNLFSPRQVLKPFNGWYGGEVNFFFKEKKKINKKKGNVRQFEEKKKEEKKRKRNKQQTQWESPQ